MATIYSLIVWGGTAGKTVTSINTGTDVITLAAHGLQTGTAVRPTTTVSGVSSSTTYYARSVSSSTFTLHPTLADASANTNITNLTATTTFTLKSAYYVGLSDKSRWTYSTVEYIYDGIASWRSARNTAGVSVYDDEVVEIYDGFVDTVTADTDIDWGAASTTITTMVNGTRSSAAFHAGVIGPTALTSTGYCVFVSGAINGIDITAGNVTVDGIFMVAQNSSGICIRTARFGTTVKNCVLRGNKPAGASSQAGLRCNQPAVGQRVYNNVILEIGGGGFYTAADQGAGALYYNNLAHNCNVGFYWEGANNRGFFYNNISVGNDTNWTTPQSGSIEGAGYNGGESGNTPWNTGTATAITTYDSTDFANYTNHDFRPASSTAPQVDTGTTVPSGVGFDILAGYRPSYVDGTDIWDVGPLEYDWGNGPPPVSITFTGLQSGSTVRVFDTGTQTVQDANTNTGTTWTTSGVGGTADYTIFKDGYVPIRITGVELTDGLSIDGSQTLDRAFVASSGLTY